MSQDDSIAKLLGPLRDARVDQASAGRLQDAGARLAAALRDAPKQTSVAEAMLECARGLAIAGIRAPSVADNELPRAQGRLSFIVCSIHPARLARLARDLQQHLANDSWELVHIADARSLSEGFTRGLRCAQGDLIICCHDDIGILCDNFADRLRRHLAAHDLIGVAGTDLLTGPSWHWSGVPNSASWVATPRPDGAFVLTLVGARGPVVTGAQALDGVFIAARRDIFERVGFDAEIFDNFHLYDIDLSYRAHRSGLDCAVALDLLIWHESGGRFAETWRKYALRLVDKFPELRPVSPAAPYLSGDTVVPSAHLAAPVYAWISHWLRNQSAEGG